MAPHSPRRAFPPRDRLLRDGNPGRLGISRDGTLSSTGRTSARLTWRLRSPLTCAMADRRSLGRSSWRCAASAVQGRNRMIGPEPHLQDLLELGDRDRIRPAAPPLSRSYTVERSRFASRAMPALERSPMPRSSRRAISAAYATAVGESGPNVPSGQVPSSSHSRGVRYELDRRGMRSGYRLAPMALAPASSCSTGLSRGLISTSGRPSRHERPCVLVVPASRSRGVRPALLLPLERPQQVVTWRHRDRDTGRDQPPRRWRAAVPLTHPCDALVGSPHCCSSPPAVRPRAGDLRTRQSVWSESVCQAGNGSGILRHVVGPAASSASSRATASSARRSSSTSRSRPMMARS
jgi:hypothetical protein